MSGSGLTIAYGDRPIARAHPGTDGVYATFEFLQYLQRLTSSHGNNVATASALQDQVNTNTSAIGVLNSEVSTLTTGLALNVRATQSASGSAGIALLRVPDGATVVQAGAVALTSGTATQLTTLTVNAGTYVLFGTIYLTGSGSVTIAQASVGMTTAVIETAPGAFATGWFGGGASPGSLGVDLSVGTCAQLIPIVAPLPGPWPVYLNVKATFTGAISAYGSLIAWLADG
jgi:hypothetical protein